LLLSVTLGYEDKNMSDINLHDCSLNNLKEILSLKMKELEASQNYLENVMGFSHSKHITVTLERVKQQTKECEEIVQHMEKRMTFEKMTVIINIQNMSTFLGKEIPFEILETKSIESLRLFQMDLLENYNEKARGK